MKNLLLDKALSDAGLLNGWAKVRENQGCAGVDGETIEAFESKLLSRLGTLREEVVAGRYSPRPLLRVVMEEPGKKPRPLSIPTIRDRVLQSAVAQVLQPLFEAEFEECSFAYRTGRSVDMAVDRVLHYRDEGFRWVVDADISSFFDEINHRILLRDVTRIVHEKALLDLIESWIKAEVQDGDARWRLRKGVPQGSPISPLLSNLYLDRLDEALLEEDLQLVRFADDFLVLCKNRKRAEKALELTEEILDGLRLGLNHNKTRIVDFDGGFRFLGVQFVRTLAFRAKHAENHDVIVQPRRQPGSDASSCRLAMDQSPDRAIDAVTNSTSSRSDTVMALAMEKAVSERTGTESSGPQAEMQLTGNAEAAEPELGNMSNRAVAVNPRLRTLYLLRDGCTLRKESERFVITQKKEVIREIPSMKIDQIIVIGNSWITTPAMHYCLEKQIPVVLCSRSGRYLGAIDGFGTDRVLLQQAQFMRAQDPHFCLRAAKAIVGGKLKNTCLILRRRARKRSVPYLEEAAGQIERLVIGAKRAESLDELRGYEGAAAKQYFAAFSALIDPEWGFKGRVRRPPTDPVNAMLSFGYSVLFTNMYAFVSARGLNPHVGFLHPIRPGHPALVSDMMEEFRAIVVDVVVWNLVLQGKVQRSGFTIVEGGEAGCALETKTRTIFIDALESKLNAAVTHPGSGDALDYRRCIDEQVHRMATVIRTGDIEYTPMTLR